MSTERKLLKIICFLYVLDAIACLAFGGLVLAGAGTLSASDIAVVGGYEFPLLPSSTSSTPSPGSAAPTRRARSARSAS